ncbi:MAG: hypothetical protein EA346_02485 [Thioalkalivibrio sp.]|nr:MAG: hypothetical protein EA346_02485 [Thioalkalivibrio sp.]
MIKVPDDRDTRNERRSPANPRGEARTPHTDASDSRRPNKIKPLIPILIFGGFATLIASQEVPAFADWLERVFQPAQWQTKASCRDAVLEDIPAGSYARLQDGGSLNQTPDGPSVMGIRFAMLGQDGEEQIVTYDCYLAADGQLHRLTLRTR